MNTDISLKLNFIKLNHKIILKFIQSFNTGQINK